MHERVDNQSHSSMGLIADSSTSDRSTGRAAELAKIWLRLIRYHSLALCRLPARVLARADSQRIEKLRREMVPIMRSDPTSAAKYADYRRWLPFNVIRIGALSLHRSPPLRLLDIGCGPGYFLAAALLCGHECFGIDAPAAALTETEARVYRELLAALGCEQRVSPLLIERFVPMSLPLRELDLITAYWICFNRHRQPDEWSAPEWRFFVDDALSYLRPGGVLHLELNSNPERYGPRMWYDDETSEFFRSAGSVDGGVVRIVKR